MTKKIIIQPVPPALYSSKDGKSTISFICSETIPDSRKKQYESKLEETMAMVRRLDQSYKQAEQICNTRRKSKYGKMRFSKESNRILLLNE